MKRILITFSLSLSLLIGSISICYGQDEELRRLELRAEQGVAEAQFNLGVMYFNGDGVTQDFETALKWYSLAAEQGNAGAQYSLGYMYVDGLGVTQDYRTALKWFSLAAEQGNAGAQYSLGLMYYNGDGVLQDYVRAHMWSNISAANGFDGGAEFRDKAAKYLTTADISKAQEMARECVDRNYKGC